MRPTAPLVGRHEELERLCRVLDEHDEVGGRAALVIAEAGAGKTRLIEEALAAVAPPAERTVVVRGGELTATLPFVALRRALRRHVGTSPGTGRGRRTGDEAASRSALIEACADAIERLALDGPVVLVVDDAHWLDSGSSTVLDLLVRQLASVPIHMVIATRPHPQPPTLSVLRRALRRSGRLEHIRLPPLRPTDALRITESVLGGPAGPRMQTLVQGAAGNPLYCTEIGLACRDRVTRKADGRLDLDEPTNAIDLDVIHHNLSGLDKACRARLDDVAMLGATVSISELALLAGQKPTDVVDDLDPALVAGVLREDDEGYLSFRHDLVRDAVIDAIPRTAAAARHREIVQAFDAAGLPSTSWAGHLPLADWSASPGAWELFERVGEEVASHATAEAADLLGHARRVVPGDPPLSFVSLHLEVLLDADRDDEVMKTIRALPAHLRRARDDLSSETIDLLAPRLLEAFWSMRGLTDGLTVTEVLEPVMHLAGPGTRDVVRADGHLSAALVHGHAEHAPPVLGIAADAWARGDERLAATAGSYGAFALALGGDLGGCTDVHGTWIRRLLDADCRPATVEGMLSGLDLSIRAPDAVTDPLLTAATSLERLGPPTTHVLGLLQSRRALDDGRWTEALSLIDDFVDWDTAHGYPNLGLPSRATSPVRVYVGVGRLDDAREVLEPGAAHLDVLRPAERRLHHSTHFRDQAIVDLVAEGRTPTLDEAYSARLDSSAQRCCDRELPLFVSLAALAGRADLVAAYDRHVAGCSDLKPAHAALLALLLRRDGINVRAVAARALSGHDFLSAMAAVGAADDDAAKKILLESRDRADACGATTWADWADRSLSDLGVERDVRKREDRPVTGVRALTPAERRVLPLILDGLLYREIAEKLHNSRRTIESHAASILRKLDVSSRRELADVIGTDDLAAVV